MCYDEHNHKTWLPYWGRSHRKLRLASPLDSGLRARFPLTGEVDKPRGKERALLWLKT